MNIKHMCKFTNLNLLIKKKKKTFIYFLMTHTTYLLEMIKYSRSLKIRVSILTFYLLLYINEYAL